MSDVSDDYARILPWVGNENSGRLHSSVIEPKAPGIYQFEIPENTMSVADWYMFSLDVRLKTGSITIDSICLIMGDADPVPGTVIFQNYSFDAGLEGWESVGVTTGGFGGANLPNGRTIFAADAGLGIIKQSVVLYSDGISDKSYTIAVTLGAAPNGLSGITTVDVSYQVGDTGNLTLIESIDVATAALSNFTFNYVSSTQVTVPGGTTIDDEFHIIIETKDAHGDVVAPGTPIPGIPVGVTVPEVCLSPTDGEWTGYGGEGVTPPISSTCTAVTQPDSDAVYEWIYYHWLQLDSFFNAT